MQKNVVNSHNHLSRHLDALETSAQEALKEELAEKFGLCVKIVVGSKDLLVSHNRRVL